MRKLLATTLLRKGKAYVALLLLTFLASCFQSPPQLGRVDPLATDVIRINAGGPAATLNSINWEADQYFSGGKSYRNLNVTEISVTDDDVLYLTERSSTSNLGRFSYQIPVLEPGIYRVRLHFAEIYWGAAGGGAAGSGKRVFSVTLEGNVVALKDYDIYAEVGAETAVVKSFEVTITDGVLNIDFAASVNQPKVSAIEVSLADQTQTVGAWSSLASSSQNRQEVSDVQVSGKFYLAGGSTLHEVYDPIANSWSTLAPLPSKLDHIQGVAVNGLIYYIGGLSSWPGPNVSTVYIYNPATNTFRQGASMPATRARGAGGVAAYNGKIFYAGGLHESSAVAWFDAYDPASDTWQVLPDMPTVRDHFQAAVLNGIFYAIGGRNKDINATTGVVYAYNFTDQKWSTLPTQLPTQRGGFATAVLGEEILIIGGEGGGKTYNVVEAYRPTTNTWRTLAPMPTARHGIQAAECNSGVYIAAGGTVQGGSGATNKHEVFFLNGSTACNPSEATFTRIDWSQVAAAPLARTEAQGTVAGNKLYVFGGYTSWTPFCTTTQSHMYDPTTSTWTRLPDMPAPWTHAGVAVDGRDIYVAGGYLNEPNCTRDEVATTDVYKFNIDTKTWSNIPPLPAPRGSGGLVRLGRYLHFFGGTDTSRVDKGDHWALLLDGGTTWQALASLPNPRSHMGYSVLNGKIYAVGGQHCYKSCAVDQTSVHTYDPATDTWTEVAGLPIPLSHISSSTVVVGNRIITLGGERAYLNDVDSVFAYDPVANSWTTLTPLPSKRNAATAGVINGTIFLSGGGDFSTTTYKGVPSGGGATPNKPPTANFSSSCSNLSCTFSDSSTDTDGTVTAWNWNFGDNTTSTSRSPSHSYSTAGNYSVSLTVTDNGGAINTVTKSITVTAPSSQAVTSLSLINANTDQVIRQLMNGDTIDYSTLGTSNLSIRANTSPATVGSVRFTLDGSPYRIENQAPYAIAGDGNGGTDYYPISPALAAGSHTLTATPYTQSNTGGAAGTALTVSFTIQ